MWSLAAITSGEGLNMFIEATWKRSGLLRELSVLPSRETIVDFKDVILTLMKDPSQNGIYSWMKDSGSRVFPPSIDPFWEGIY